MNIINENILLNEDELNKYLNNYLLKMSSCFNLLESHKQILLNYIEKIADFPIENVNPDTSDSLVSFLTDLKNYINLIDIKCSMLNTFKQKIDTENKYTVELLNGIYKEYNEISTDMFNNLIKIDNFFASSTKLFDLSFTNNITTQTHVNEEKVPFVEKEISNTLPTQKENTINNYIIENTLIISEKSGKIILPFSINEINTILQESSGKYSTLEDVIKYKYTLSYDNYKNPTFARFKETYKLARKIEHLSLKESINLALELMFNYELHPAIITACKNIDELDIYLDYLETNETEKFDFFNVKFEITPAVVKEQKRI